MSAELFEGATRARKKIRKQWKLPLPQIPRDPTLPVTTNYTMAFCTILKDCKWQVQHALPWNLMVLWPHRSWVCIHLVDFGSKDGGLEFIKDNCKFAMANGFLRLYTASGEPFHAAKAKNTALQAASQDILVNFDVNNLLEAESAPKILDLFKQGANVFHMEGRQGTCGRFACWREDFHKIGGYDEDCHPVDGPDVDLLERLRLLHKGRGVRREGMGTHGTFAIPNKKKQILSGVKSLNMTWQEMETGNCLEFQKRRSSFGCVRNLGRVPALSIKEVLPE